MKDRYFEINSEDPTVIGIVTAMLSSARAQMGEHKIEAPHSHVMLAVALTRLVWESGRINENIPPTVIQALLNMAVDAGWAERIGMVQMPGKGDTLQ
jgi:hypothetical protein